MAEPTSSAGGFLGLKFSSLIAGFCGGVVSLSYMQSLGTYQRVVAVLTGAASANYGLPVVNHFFDVPGDLQYGVAFVIGLTSMNIIPGIIKLSETLRDDPLSILSRFKK